jgi:signal transduction histidine kinase
MELRRKLTLQFTFIVAAILLVAEFTVYVFSELRWQDDFYSRLTDKGNTIARLLIDVEGVDTELLRLIETNNISSMPFEEIHVFGMDNQQIFCNRDTSYLVISPSLLSNAGDGNRVALNQGKYTVVGFRYPDIEPRILVFVGAIDVYGLRKLSNLRFILIIVFISSLMILVLSGRVFANRALKPILKVIDEVLAITESTLHLRVNEGNGRDEIARLAKTFNRMLERLETAFKIQQNFIANASHEIRTPLAYITGQLEVGLLRERTSAEYTRMMRSVLEDIVALSHTTNRLLLLTMTDSEMYHIPMESVRLDEILWEAQSELMKSHPDYKIIIRFGENIDNEILLTTNGNSQLLRIAIVNLMENGCKYSAEHTVFSFLESLDSRLVIRFRDEGVGIPPEEHSLVFEPFYRARNAEKMQGTGLGLPLVQRIIRLHRGSVTLTSEPGKGTEFTVVLPILQS